MIFMAWTVFLFLSAFRYDYGVVLFLSCLWPCLMFICWGIVYAPRGRAAARLGCQASSACQGLSASSSEGPNSCSFLPLQHRAQGLALSDGVLHHMRG